MLMQLRAISWDSGVLSGDLSTSDMPLFSDRKYYGIEDFYGPFQAWKSIILL